MANKPNFNHNENSGNRNIKIGRDNIDFNNNTFDDDQTLDSSDDFDFDDDITDDTTDFPNVPIENKTIRQNNVNQQARSSMDQSKQSHRPMSQNQQNSSKSVRDNEVKTEKKSPLFKKVSDNSKTVKEKPKKQKISNHKKTSNNFVRPGHENDTTTNKNLNVKKIIVPVVAAVAVVCVGIAGFKYYKANMVYDPLVEAAQQKDKIILASESDNSSSDSSKAVETDADKYANIENTVLNVGKSADLPVVITTQLEGESGYTDHSTYITVKNNGIIEDENKISDIIDKYNENASSVINADSLKQDGYTAQIYDIEIDIPDDFPTSDTKHNKTYMKFNEPTFVIRGTDKENLKAVISEDNEYAIPVATNVTTDDFSNTVVGGAYHTYWLVLMPSDVKTSAYEYDFTIGSDEMSGDHTIMMSGQE